jgi:hypothetical protein
VIKCVSFKGLRLHTPNYTGEKKVKNFSGPEIQGVDKERGLGRIEKCSPAAQTN